MTTQRNSYHTNFKLAVKHNLIDREIIQQLPKTTLNRFKNSDYSSIIGTDTTHFLNTNEDLIKDLAQSKILIKHLESIIKIKRTIIKIKTSVINEVQKMKETIDVITHTKDIIGFDKALSYFNIKPSTFYSWLNQITYPCHDSFIGKCIKRWPNQIAVSQVNKIKELCYDNQFTGWPLASIYYFAKQNKEITMSLHSFYKYAKLLNLSKRRIKKPPYKTGIRATKPNEIWHADVTIFKTENNVKHYIYILMDNFSRKILSYAISTQMSAKIRLQTIEEAYIKTRKEIKEDIDTPILFICL